PLMISASGLAPPVVDECERVLSQKVMVLGELRELVLLMEQEQGVADWLREKVRWSTLDRRPLAVFGDDFQLRPAESPSRSLRRHYVITVMEPPSAASGRTYAKTPLSASGLVAGSAGTYFEVPPAGDPVLGDGPSHWWAVSW
ncbi:hypothetical protein AB4Z54_29980, partial [Streptomyces sp. MCAF7]